MTDSENPQEFKKHCSNCKRFLSAENFHKNKTGKYGLVSACKDCVSARHKDWYNRNREYKLEQHKIWREENDEWVKEYNRQWNENNREHIKQRNKRYREENYEYCRYLDHQYNLRNREQKREYNKKYYLDNQEAILEYGKRHYWENREYYLNLRREYVKANREYCLEASRQWVKENPEKRKQWENENRDKLRARCAKRHAAKMHRCPIWADKKELQRFYEEAEKLSKDIGIDYVVDHYYPLQGDSVSGLHVPENLQIITSSENGRKGNKHPREFYNG